MAQNGLLRICSAKEAEERILAHMSSMAESVGAGAELLETMVEHQEAFLERLRELHVSFSATDAWPLACPRREVLGRDLARELEGMAKRYQREDVHKRLGPAKELGRLLEMQATALTFYATWRKEAEEHGETALARQLAEIVAAKQGLKAFLSQFCNLAPSSPACTA